MPNRVPSRILSRAVAGALALGLTAGAALAASFGDTEVKIEQVAGDLRGPWAVDFLPGGGFLVTERRGRLWHYGPEGRRQAVSNIPDVAAVGQGGLLDVMVPRDFASSREVFLSYARAQEGGGQGTALAKGRLSADGTRLENLTRLFQMAPGSSGGKHFGSRIVEGPEGHIFLTMGERGDRPAAQDLSRHNGSVIRINRDGSVPRDNPFVGREGAQPEIWSYGHRNPQGAALGPNGRIWVAEHGAKGGDEVNLIEKGANYGWPVISYGTHYSGAKIGQGTSKPGMKQPVSYWDPSIAPSGMAFYEGELFPGWQGDAFVGSLKFDYLARLSGDPLAQVAKLETRETARVRDVAVAPDGSVWFISEDRGAIYRVTPAE